jgi:4'-phosphopantetheinyl transferase
MPRLSYVSTLILAIPCTRQRLTPASIEIDLWCIPLQDQQGAWSWLSPSEQKQIQAWGADSIRGQRFWQSRAWLRWVLSQYVVVAPPLIQFDYTRNGKPLLDAQLHDPVWQFSWSHTPGLAVAAITRHILIGVDVEYMQPRPQTHRIARRYFDPQTQARLASLAEPELTLEFLSHWTGREAKIKAIGGRLFGVISDGYSYSLVPVKIGSDYVGTLAILNQG